jgi:hypothetical protein
MLDANQFFRLFSLQSLIQQQFSNWWRNANICIVKIIIFHDYSHTIYLHLHFSWDNFISSMYINTSCYKITTKQNTIQCHTQQYSQLHPYMFLFFLLYIIFHLLKYQRISFNMGLVSLKFVNHMPGLQRL